MKRVVALVVGIIVALLPSAMKIPLYRRFYGYDIGKKVTMGFSPLIGVRRCRIGDGARIGHFNAFYHVEELDIGREVSVGFLNLFRGGRIRLGEYVSVLRMNLINAIRDADTSEGNPESVLELGLAAIVTSGHRIDFTDRVVIGAGTVIGGQGSALWTHSRQRTRPILIGAHCYLGAGVQIAPGVEVADMCVVSLGAVLIGRFSQPRSLIVGNPARAVRPLRARELCLVARRTRDDLPDEVARSGLPEELWALTGGAPRFPLRRH
jgi:acetyltransferase-like isoleucine patch superfamily enzyme